MVDPAKSVTTLTVNVRPPPRGRSPSPSPARSPPALPLPAGTPLTVTRTDDESPKGKPLGTKALGANDRFSFTDTPHGRRQGHLPVSYAGDRDPHRRLRGRRHHLAKDATTLTLDGNGKTHTYGKKVIVHRPLGKTYTEPGRRDLGRPVRRRQAEKLVKKGKVNSKGKLSATPDDDPEHHGDRRLRR